MPDQIHIEALEVWSHIGVPAEEREAIQPLNMSLTLEPLRNFRALEDCIEATVDYAAVCQAVKALAADRPRKLVETLAEETAAALLADFPIRRVTLEVRKFILPGTDYVAIRIEREKA